MPDCFRHLVIYVLAFLDLHQHLRAKYPARKHHAICECTLHALFLHFSQNCLWRLVQKHPI